MFNLLFLLNILMPMVNAPYGELRKSVFKIAWLLYHSIRMISYVSDACLRCQAESKQDMRYGRQDCVVVWGECNHSFHYCCMSLWVKQNNRCPLCQQEWSIQRMGK